MDKKKLPEAIQTTQAVARRVYPERSEGVYLFSEDGTATFETVRVWEMMPSNPY